MSKSENLVERLMTEADQCRNDGAGDIAILLDEAVAEILHLQTSEFSLRSAGGHLSTLVDELRAEKTALEKQLDALRNNAPVAWGLFAKVEGGLWNLQHPVRFSEEDAKADRAMYEEGTLLDVRPLCTCSIT